MNIFLEYVPLAYRAETDKDIECFLWFLEGGGRGGYDYEDIQNNHAETVMVAHNPDELAITAQKVALIHAIEGGFQLGDTDDEIRTNVIKLAGRGVAYITVAHLFFRQVATDVPAVPFLADAVYDFICPQKTGLGLTPRGQTLIEAMVRIGILIDITHMSQNSIDDTFTFLNETFPNQSIPVVATHAACKLDGLNFKYNIIDRHIKAVAKSDGVVGLIFCKHYRSGGIATPKNFDDSMKILLRHIDHIHSVTGRYDNIGFGSDLDGFIKPTLPGFQRPLAFAEIEDRLTTQYGAEIAAKICSGNAMRVLRQVWQQPRKPLRAAANHRGFCHAGKS